MEENEVGGEEGRREGKGTWRKARKERENEGKEWKKKEQRKRIRGEKK